ncbi:MAG: hypothetical protein ACKO96_34625, partial [Flammeovirgaceae bacterium]
MGNGFLYQDSYRFNFSTGFTASYKYIIQDNNGNNLYDSSVDTVIFKSTNGSAEIQLPGYYWVGGYFNSSFVRMMPPIVLDLDRDGIAPADVRVSFDVDGDGVTDRVGWISPGDAFL